jgi:hypothetical protein
VGFQILSVEMAKMCVYPALLVILLVKGNIGENGDEREDTPIRSYREQPLLI